MAEQERVEEEQIPSEPVEEQTPEEDGAIAAFDEALKPKEDEKPAEEPEAEKAPEEAERSQEAEAEKSAEAEKPEEGEKPEEDQAVEDEIKEYGLKTKAAERFRDMSQQIKELFALKEEAEPLREKAEQYDQMVESWNQVQAQPEQVQTAQAIIGAVNSGDPDKIMAVAKAYRQAADALEKDLGISADTSELDPDLQQRVEEYGLDMDSAKELQQARALARSREQYGQRQAQTQAEQQAEQAARQQGVADIEALNGELAAADPQFEQKLAYLQPALEQIRDHLPPHQWAQAVRQAYQRIPNLPEAPKPAQQPVRPTGAPQNLAPAPKSAEDAFDLALRGAAE